MTTEALPSFDNEPALYTGSLPFFHGDGILSGPFDGMWGPPVYRFIHNATGEHLVSPNLSSFAVNAQTGE